MTTRTSSFLAGLAFVTGSSLLYHACMADLLAESFSRLACATYLEIN